MRITSGFEDDVLSWRRLFSAIIDGSATEEQLQEVNELLRKNPQAVDEYLAYIDLHASLSASSMVTMQLSSQPLSPGVNQGKNRWLLRLPVKRLIPKLAIAGGAILAVMVSLVLLFPSHPVAHAVLVRNVGSDLTHSDLPVSIGETIGQRVCQLTHGMIELKYARGVQLVIEGPARFCCQSPETLVLYEGRLSADVPPPAIGFRVETPKMEVIDRGTKFGVDVGPEGTSEVHVFQGEVIAKGNMELQPTRLNGGESRRISQEGEIASVYFRNSPFVERQELEAMERGWDFGQKERWQAAVRMLKSDKDLVTYYQFGDPALQKSIHSARRVQGRFPGVVALDFVEEQDYVFLNIDGTFPELTMMSWVRLDQHPYGEHALFHSDHWHRDGQVHWLVAQNCQVRFSLHRGGRDPVREVGELYHWPESTRTIVNDIGRWVHLAVTYHADRQAVRFYINGEFDSETIDPDIRQAVLGSAQIGNWRNDNPAFPNRRLCGRMDEFVILRRMLTDREISEYYKSSTPYHAGNAKATAKK